ncbi:MAG: NAD(P)/FAD-dependent oxidoreductase [Planctomycetota bacterium]
MKIAVAGAGIAGSSAAWQLAAQGHQVTLFEQAPQCGPVGAGILLQPSGQAVLAELGILSPLLKKSAQIRSLHAKHRHGGTLIHLRYDNVPGELHAMGVLRSEIFALLYGKCQSQGVDVREGHTIANYRQDDSQVRVWNTDDECVGDYELLVAADGSRSRLRHASGLTRCVREYPDAALWTVGPYSGPQDCLLQIVGRDGRLIGMLPVGDGKCSFFWGLKKSDEPRTRSAGVEAWKREVAAFYPDAEEPVAHIQSLEEVTYATYRNASMRRVRDGRVVFIGDAAHATSPHLGQGLNLALEDAFCLAQQLAAHPDLSVSLPTYEQNRAPINRFYSTLTGTLTPFFQTSSRLLQFGRDLALPLMPNLPYIGRQMVYTMAGLKTGWLGVRRPPPTQ